MAPSPLPQTMVEPLVRAALLEDLGRAGALTTGAIVPADARSTTLLVARQHGVIAGLGLARGPARGRLTTERTALNFLCHLSGVATATPIAASGVDLTSVGWLTHSVTALATSDLTTKLQARLERGRSD
jgi:nicotinate-nucleotide pyrophosphorylase (carboxylating)